MNTTMDQEISVKIELTANHQGFMEFRLCAQNNPLVPVSQACLDRHLLEQVGGVGARYHPGPGNKVFQVRLELPRGLTCSQCVLQWRYFAANNWGEFPLPCLPTKTTQRYKWSLEHKI